MSKLIIWLLSSIGVYSLITTAFNKASSKNNKKNDK